MGPVAAAAKAQGMIYGLWFEPERVVAGHRSAQAAPRVAAAPQGRCRRHLPAATSACRRCRSTSSTSSKASWTCRASASTARTSTWTRCPTGASTTRRTARASREMKYIEGLYAYWDRIADDLARQPARGVRQRRPPHRPGDGHAACTCTRRPTTGSTTRSTRRPVGR